MDPERLASLYLEMGELHANAAISRAMADLAETMEKIRTGIVLRQGNSCLGNNLAHITAISEPLGLLSLATASRNAADALASNDEVATFATFARLERVANQSLKMVWDLYDLSQ